MSVTYDELYEKVGALTATLKILFDNVASNRLLTEGSIKSNNDNAIKIAVMEVQVQILKEITNILPQLVQALDDIQDKINTTHADGQLSKATIESFRKDVIDDKALREKCNELLASIEEEIEKINPNSLNRKINELLFIAYEQADKDKDGRDLSFGKKIKKKVIDTVTTYFINGLIILIIIICSLALPIVGSSIKDKILSFLSPPKVIQQQNK